MSKSPHQLDTDIAEFLVLGGRVVLEPVREEFGADGPDPETAHGDPTRNARAIPMSQLTSNTKHSGRDARNETTPWHIWEHAVFEIAGVPVEEGRKYATRGRIQRAYQAGEPAWMAADMVRKFVDGARRAAREVDGIDDLRRVMIAGALPRGSR
jgi:hypothetical protein